MSEWQPIETYPRDMDTSTGCAWGPSSLLLIHDPFRRVHIPVAYVGHLEADMWLVRAAEDEEAWSEMARAPTHWMPLPPSPITEEQR